MKIRKAWNFIYCPHISFFNAVKELNQLDSTDVEVFLSPSLGHAWQAPAKMPDAS
jgi:hypothetical protein